MDDEKRKAAGAKLDAMFREEIREMERKGATAAETSMPSSKAAPTISTAMPLNSFAIPFSTPTNIS